MRVFQTRTQLSRLVSLPVMAALCAYCVLIVLLFTRTFRVIYAQTEDVIGSDSEVSEHVVKLSKYLKLHNNLSPVTVLGNMKTLEMTSANVSDAGPCDAALEELLFALEQGKVWAIQMIDASSKVPDGLLSGNLVDLGTYDECVDISVDRRAGYPSFTGQHCLVVMHLNFTTLPGIASKGVLAALGNSLAYTFSLCLPSTCSSDSLERSLGLVAEDVNLLLASANLSVQFTVDQSDCHVKLRPSLDAAEVAGIMVTLCSLIVVALSTIIDLTLVYQYDSPVPIEPRGCLKLLTAFSVYSNCRRLMDTRVVEGSLSVLHGLKFISIAWVAVGHRVKFSAQNPLTNLLELADYIPNWSSMIVLNATLSVDVFFVISGILNTYVYMSLAERRGRSFKSHVVGYVHRYLRLTPAYALMILVTATWLYRTGDGPLWDRLVGDAKHNCVRYWWSGLMYINNYYNPNKNCMMQSWYLAADMQLFWLSPLVLYPLWRWPLLGLMNLTGLIILSTIVPFLVAFIDQIKTPIPISFDQEKVNREMAELYFPTHTKAVAYFIGIMTGYYLHLLKTKRRKYNITLRTNLLIWVLAVLSLAFGLFGGHHVFQMDTPYDKWESSLYIGLYRTFWSAGIAWIILASTVGYGGVVSSWLSAGLFVPLGRLTYTIYLTHVAVILYGIGSMRQPQHFTYYEMALKFLGEFVIATCLALILSLTIEAPVMVLEKVIFKIRGSRRVHVATDGENCSPVHPDNNRDTSHEA